jgi:hypothetical protein
VPFLRYARDKKGYETTYVMHSYRGTPTSGDARVLYLFRSPAHIGVGRRALDDEARAGLEHTHPDLSFDWHSLVKDAAPIKVAPPVRPHGRESRPQRQAPAPASVVVATDDSVLGRVLGVSEAARLRARYGEILQRITRRSRSPEERDQLVERLRRLNPDDWGNEGAVRAGVSTVEAEWDAVAEALPARRRGRRGGRRRDEETATPALETSGIIAGDGEADARQEDAQMGRADRIAGDSGDDDRVGRPGPGDGIPSDD